MSAIQKLPKTAEVRAIWQEVEALPLADQVKVMQATQELQRVTRKHGEFCSIALALYVAVYKAEAADA